MNRPLLACAALMLATAASAQTQTETQTPALRNLCTDRPGLSTPPCVVDKGHLQIEAGIGDWTLDRQPDTRTDTIVAGEFLARLGVTKEMELRLGWNAYGHVRERDRQSGDIQRQSGTGDVTLGLLQDILAPGGNGLALGILPQVSLPTGGKAIGAGTWGAALLIPGRIKLGDVFRIELTPEIDAAPNQSRHGRHLAYAGVVGLSAKIGDKADVTAEIEGLRDRDPEKRATEVLAALSYDYRPAKMLQFDVQAVAGLNHNSPDVQLSFGISRKF